MYVSFPMRFSDITILNRITHDVKHTGHRQSQSNGKYSNTRGILIILLLSMKNILRQFKLFCKHWSEMRLRRFLSGFFVPSDFN